MPTHSLGPDRDAKDPTKLIFEPDEVDSSEKEVLDNDDYDVGIGGSHERRQAEQRVKQVLDSTVSFRKQAERQIIEIRARGWNKFG